MKLFLPLDMWQSWWDGTGLIAHLLAVGSTVPETATDFYDVASLEVASGGGYMSGEAGGLVMPALSRESVISGGDKITEWCYTAAAWEATGAPVSRTFEFAALTIGGNGRLVGVLDYEAAQTLTVQHFAATLPASTNFAGKFVLTRMVHPL